MTTLTKNTNYSFKVTVNHGNNLLNDSKIFTTVESFKAYVKQLNIKMKIIRTVTVLNLDTFETLATSYALTGINITAKYKLFK